MTGANGWWLSGVPAINGGWEMRRAYPMRTQDLYADTLTIVGYTYDPAEVMAWLGDGKLPQ